MSEREPSFEEDVIPYLEALKEKTGLDYASVAPNMGDLDGGVKAFQQSKPPYARGGNTPASKHLEENILKYVGATNASAEDYQDFSVALLSSGQAANHVAFKAFSGQDMVSTNALFGTTKTDLTMSFKAAGNHIEWVDPCDVQAFIDASTDNTGVWFVEAVSNPAGRVPDFKALRAAADEQGVALVIDTTLAVGMEKFNAYEYADVITCSLTKQAGGGENANVGGAVLINEKFDWKGKADKFPMFDLYYGDDIPDEPFSKLVYKISLHEGSGVISPQVANSISRSLPGLADRVKVMGENAEVLVKTMSVHPAVESVKLAGVNTDPENDARAQEYLGGPHFVVLFDLKDGFDAAADFVNSDQFLHAVALGQKTTAISNPASSTHRQYSEEQLAGMGIKKGTIRMSVGDEDAYVLNQRLKGALAGRHVDEPWPGDVFSYGNGFEDGPVDQHAENRDLLCRQLGEDAPRFLESMDKLTQARAERQSQEDRAPQRIRGIMALLVD